MTWGETFGFNQLTLSLTLGIQEIPLFSVVLYANLNLHMLNYLVSLGAK